ncbi:MAG: hypothetical protein JMDDDDMK_05498 [Acidobacteria bacterium]|nr:hypothetical protein [Acidobacteriota bacterium]
MTLLLGFSWRSIFAEIDAALPSSRETNSPASALRLISANDSPAEAKSFSAAALLINADIGTCGGCVVFGGGSDRLTRRREA